MSDTSSSNRNTDSSSKKRNWVAVGLNLVLVVAVAAFIGWLAMLLAGKWTGHGEQAVVPDVKGLYYDEAYNLLTAGGFRVELSDSVYDLKVKPGMVVDQNPHVGAVVKPGRLVYLSINAFTPKNVTVPRITDMSSRQARAILEGLGISNVVVDTVPSEFQDLVISATVNGAPVMPGARLPVNSVIHLEVGSGLDPYALDSLDTDAAAPADRLDLI